MLISKSNPISFLQYESKNYSTFTQITINQCNQYNTSFDTYKGLLFMFLSCILKSIYSFLCKVILERNTTLTSFHLLTYKAYWMGAIGAILFLTFYRFERKLIEEITHLSKNNLTQLSIRAVLSVISGSLTTLSLKYMPISDVYAIYYLYPGIVMILSYFFLKEIPGLLDVVCLISCLIGVLCVIRPSLIFNNQSNINGALNIYIFLVFIAAVFKGIEDILIRNIGKQVHCLSIPIIYSIVGMVLFPLAMIFNANSQEYNVNLSIGDWSVIILISVVNFSQQVLLAMAIQNENVGRVSMINYLQVLFMFLSDIFIFNREVIFFDFLGIGFIFSFNFTNGILKAYNRNIELNRLKTSYDTNIEENTSLIK